MIIANGIKIEPTIFPDKTSQVWKIDESLFREPQVNVVWEFEDEGEIMHVAQLKALLDSRSRSGQDVNLSIPYLPYARQDKNISNEATFARVVFADMIAEMGFDHVTCFDIHSKNIFIESIEPKKEVIKSLIDCGSDILVYPDKGALEKYTPTFAPFVDSVYAEKIRDQLTGDITGMTLHGEVKGLKCLIVDDICDGGMTFIKLADLLISNGATEVNLYVSHGLFTKGIKALTDAGINHIYTRKGKVI